LTDRNFREQIFLFKGDLILAQPDVMVPYIQLYRLLSTRQTSRATFAERITRNQAVFQEKV